MKRRNIIISFLLAACLIVGVGYATLVDILDVGGTAEYNLSDAFDANIYFADATAVDATGDAAHNNSASVSTTNVDKATFTVKSLTAGTDEAYFIFHIKNANATAATLYLASYGISGTGNPENYYQVGYVFQNVGTADAKSLSYTPMTAGSFAVDADAEHNATIAANSDMYLYVEVSFIENTAPTGTDPVTATFAIEIGVDDASALVEP